MNENCAAQSRCDVKTPSAVEFLNRLSPVVGLGAKVPHRNLIYRGQKNSSWNLVPNCAEGRVVSHNIG